MEEEFIDENDDIYYNDDKFIAIIKTDGSAEILEFDVEYWDELPDYIAAKRLDAVRVVPLYDIAEELGLDDHITGWVDDRGLRKSLDENPVGCKIYPGTIAGDMILTLEDNDYKPKSFNDLDVIYSVLNKLGVTEIEENLDDEYDEEDGRFDAWS
ncbi:MAG: hypothetical protein MJZ78_00765 [Bacteroidales bacterium]|nr:hypothetical protein [Bacteroidales bacterium]